MPSFDTCKIQDQVQDGLWEVKSVKEQIINQVKNGLLAYRIYYNSKL